MLLCLANSIFTEVENTRSQYGISLAINHAIRKVVQIADATGCYHGHVHCFGNSTR
jgi:hypothetical protein